MASRLLLHICCGVCGASVVEKLSAQFKSITLFYSNPNIQPEAEYQKRLLEVQKLSKLYTLKLLIDDYPQSAWQKKVDPYAAEKEGGKRCEECIRYRLLRTKDRALGRFDLFTTTLSVSPYKNTAMINRLGEEIGQDLYYAADFKTDNGYKRSMDLARQYDMYRQKYCGCLFSRKN